MAAFGARLKELRENAGLSQGELAERAGIHRVQVNRLESGERSPNWTTVLALARALNVTCEAFDEGPKPRRSRKRKES